MSWGCSQFNKLPDNNDWGRKGSNELEICNKLIEKTTDGLLSPHKNIIINIALPTNGTLGRTMYK